MRAKISWLAISSLSCAILFGLAGCFVRPYSKYYHSAGKNYKQLEKLLAQGKWQAGDRQTIKIMLAVAGREEEGWLGKADMENLPCQDLATINRIWQKYSRRRFGFSVQKRIWESAGGQPGKYNSQIVLDFGELVGWRERDRWKAYDELNFDPKAPPGHLPATTGNGVSGGVWGGVATLAGKVEACSSFFDNLPDALQKAAEREVQQTQAAIVSGIRNCPGCNLVGADLRGVDLALGDLSYADLRNADLRGAILGAAKLKLADFRGANLEGAVLRQANMWAASFDNANLTGADFSCGAGSCTYLEGTSFQNANLTRANLACLDCTVVERQGLKNVNLAGANLTDALLEKTSLQGVNLCQAILPDGTKSQQGCEN